MIFWDEKQKSEAYRAVPQIEQNKHTQRISTIDGQLMQYYIYLFDTVKYGSVIT